MPILPFSTLDVFTATRFGGNPLAVVIGGEDLGDLTMQAVAAEFNLSETTFVLPPSDPRHTARIRIFNRTSEMAFAGHRAERRIFDTDQGAPFARAVLRRQAGPVGGSILMDVRDRFMDNIVIESWRRLDQI